MCKLVGFRKFVAKKSGKNTCIATILRDSTNRERQFGVIGQVAEDVFIPDDQYDFLTEKMIGKEVRLIWDKSFLERIELA